MIRQLHGQDLIFLPPWNKTPSGPSVTCSHLLDPNPFLQESLNLTSNSSGMQPRNIREVLPIPPPPSNVIDQAAVELKSVHTVVNTEYAHIVACNSNLNAS